MCADPEVRHLMGGASSNSWIGYISPPYRGVPDPGGQAVQPRHVASGQSACEEMERAGESGGDEDAVQRTGPGYLHDPQKVPVLPQVGLPTSVLPRAGEFVGKSGVDRRCRTRHGSAPGTRMYRPQVPPYLAQLREGGGGSNNPTGRGPSDRRRNVFRARATGTT